MRGKIISISSASFFLVIMLLINIGLGSVANMSSPREVKEYVNYLVTYGEEINEKMLEMREKINEKPSFEPCVSNIIEPKEIALKPNTIKSAEENSEILKDAVSGAKNGTKIILPEGKYYINSVIKLEYKKDITISASGKGAELINLSYSPFNEDDPSKTSNVFKITSCERVKIENISFDYFNHVSAEGTVIEQSGGNTYFKLFEEYKANDKQRLAGGEIITSVFTSNENGFIDERWPEAPIKLQKQSEDAYYIPMEIGSVGQTISCRFISSGPYVSYVIHARSVNGLILENLRCYSCPGGFVLATDGNSNLHFEKLNISVRKGSQRRLASNEDCLHLRNVSGRLTVKDSTFFGIGDDALNIHSQLLTVAGIKGDSVVVSKDEIDGFSLQFMFAKRGETMEFFDKNFNSIGFARVEDVSQDKITLDTLPKGLKKGFYMQNVSLSPDTFVSDSKIGFARARGLLVQAKNSIIKNCEFSNIRLSAILSAPDFEYWREGGFFDNLLVEDNKFYNCVSSHNGMAPVHITVGHDSITENPNCLLGHKNATVKNNIFEECIGENVVAYNVMNLSKD